MKIFEFYLLEHVTENFQNLSDIGKDKIKIIFIEAQNIDLAIRKFRRLYPSRFRDCTGVFECFYDDVVIEREEKEND